MKTIVLPNPPNPDDARFKSNALAFQRAVYDWMNITKGRLEQASKQNDVPLSTPFVVSSFSTNTSLTATSTGTDITDFICTLVQSFTNRGMITTSTATSQ